MERMTDYKPQEQQELEELYRKQNLRINELEQENKRLKEKIELLDNENMCLNAEIKDREEENKKLEKELDKYKKQYEHIFGDDELIYEEWLYD